MKNMNHIDNNNNNMNTYNSSLFSKHNMVDAETILHFFSLDASEDSLVRLFGIIKNDENPTVTRSNGERNIYKTKRKRRNVSLLNWSLINSLDNKTKKPIPLYKNMGFNNINMINQFISEIDKEYFNISNNEYGFCGWNYYKENKDFIETYFDMASTSLVDNTNNNKYENNYSSNRKLILYKTPSNEKTSDEIKDNKNSTDKIESKKIDLTNDEYFTSNNSLFGPIKKHHSLIEDIEITHTVKKISTTPIHIEVNKQIEDTFIYINTNIESLNDILLLVDKYPIRLGIQYNINMHALHNISAELRRLNNMIGLHTLKDSIINQIIYYIQNFHILGTHDNDYMHTVIYGPPGTGKTEIAKIIGEIFSKLGILKNRIFKKVTRADLIAGYLGQTAIKTKNVVQECLGGVLFIDEAYALGNTEKGDSFSKECIDTLCEALSNHKHEIMVIIAGYKEEMDRCFFSYNEGLQSRFVWRYSTDEYTPEELRDIFIKKVNDANWHIKEKIPTSWFLENKKHFKYSGRDIETLFAKTKISHSRRVFCKPTHYKTKLTFEDVKNGMKLYLKNNKESVQLVNTSHMYV